MTLLKIAWRNLLKRPRQSAILLLVISIGLFSIVSYLLMIDGFYLLMINTVVDGGRGHIQVHQTDYLLKREAKLTLPDPEKLQREISTTEHVESISPRVLAQGLVSSARNSNFSLIYGIDPALEKNITRIIANPVRGEFITKNDMEGIYIGEALAEQLKVDLGDKVVVMVRNIQGDLEGAALRVRGIYHAQSDEFEKANVYVSMPALRKILGQPDALHEIAMRVDNPENLQTVKNALTTKINSQEVKVETWMELSPVLKQQLDLVEGSMWILYLIVFIAMSFGIINAFLMEIFERIREFGIMMSLGTRPSSILLMLVFEAVFLGIVGAILGGIFTIIFINGVLNNQIDLSAFAEGMEFVGAGTIVPMIVNYKELLRGAVSTIIAVVIATLYPAFRAATFKPMEALRHV